MQDKLKGKRKYVGNIIYNYEVKSMANEILTVNEVADYLRMNPMTIYRLAQQGRLPASKVLGCWRFKRQEIEAWLKDQEFQPSKILVIDDDPLIGNTIKNALGKKHAVSAVETAKDALNILERERFNLIFLDLRLPDTDGLTLYKQIILSGKNIPVVVITGSTDGALLSRMVEEGVQFILNKPFTIEEVQQMLSFIKV
jgi:excisionase family DNA binding protein